MKRLLLVLGCLLLLIPRVHAAGSILENYCNPAYPKQDIVYSNTYNALTSSSWYCSQMNVAAETIWQNWLPIGMAAAMLSFMIGALIFMFGVALRNDRLRIFGIGEIYEASATSFMVVAFLFLSAVMFGLIPSYFVGNIDPYSTSLTYISHMINATSGVLLQVYDMGTLDYFYASQQVLVCAVEVDDQCTFLTALAPPIYKWTVLYGFFWPTWALFDLTIGGFMALNVEFYTILFFMYAALPAFFIPGVIFRAFLPTRQLGGMMMAIGIGFYFIMPILFSVAFYFTSQGPIASLSAISASLNRYGTGSGAITNAVSPTSPLVEDIGNAKSALSGYWLSVLFYPALISGITYAFVVQIANIIGGMGQTSSRFRAI